MPQASCRNHLPSRRPCEQSAQALRQLAQCTRQHRAANGRGKSARGAKRAETRLACTGTCVIRQWPGMSASWPAKLAGPNADPQRFAAACRLVAAQIDLLDIREARLPLLSRVLVDDTALERLTTLDLYERITRSRRRSAARELGSIRPPVAADRGQTVGNDTCSNEVDLAAVLRKVPAQKAARLPRERRNRTSRPTYLRLRRGLDTTDFGILNERSQRGKTEQKQPSNTNSARRGR